MVHPLRGHREPVPDRQVVPQLEQVLALDAAAALTLLPQHPLTGATLPQA